MLTVIKMQWQYVMTSISHVHPTLRGGISMQLLPSSAFLHSLISPLPSEEARSTQDEGVAREAPLAFPRTVRLGEAAPPAHWMLRTFEASLRTRALDAETNSRTARRLRPIFASATNARHRS